MALDLLTVEEAARELRVSAVTVRRYIKSGRLRCVRLGRNVRLRRDDIEGLVAEGSVEEFWKTVPAITANDPIWRIIGIANASELNENVAEKYKLLYEGFVAKQDRDRHIIEQIMRGERVDPAQLD